MSTAVEDESNLISRLHAQVSHNQASHILALLNAERNRAQSTNYGRPGCSGRKANEGFYQHLERIVSLLEDDHYPVPAERIIKALKGNRPVQSRKKR